jgi:hypothetical protein
VQAIEHPEGRADREGGERQRRDHQQIPTGARGGLWAVPRVRLLLHSCSPGLSTRRRGS